MSWPEANNLQKLTRLATISHSHKKMQWETADFAPSAATWQTRQNICTVFDLGLFPWLHGNTTSSTEQEVYNIMHCHSRTREPCPHVTSATKCGAWFLKYASEEINKQDMLITMLKQPNNICPSQGCLTNLCDTSTQAMHIRGFGNSVL